MCLRLPQNAEAMVLIIILMNKFDLRIRRALLPAIFGAVAIALALFQNAAAQTINIERVVAELEPEIQRALIEGKIPSASIALVSGDKVIWTGAYGYSNLWARTPATPSTVYVIGSTFKAMSTVALLQQMEQGKFKLDDHVNDYLTDFKIQNEDPKNPVTFRHVGAPRRLRGISGLGRYSAAANGGVP